MYLLRRRRVRRQRKWLRNLLIWYSIFYNDLDSPPNTTGELARFEISKPGRSTRKKDVSSSARPDGECGIMATTALIQVTSMAAIF